MTITIQALHKHLLAAGLLAGLGMGAIAQTAAPAQPAPGQAQAQQQPVSPASMAERQARRQQMKQVRMERKLAALKIKLGVSSAQEAAWNTWATAMQPAQRQRPDRAEFARMGTPERIDRMRELRIARHAEMDRRGDATKLFYGALNADQKKVFDGESLRFGKGGRGDHHRGGHGHHHQR